MTTMKSYKSWLSVMTPRERAERKRLSIQFRHRAHRRSSKQTRAAVKQSDKLANKLSTEMYGYLSECRRKRSSLVDVEQLRRLRESTSQLSNKV